MTFRFRNFSSFNGIGFKKFWYQKKYWYRFRYKKNWYRKKVLDSVSFRFLVSSHTELHPVSTTHPPSISTCTSSTGPVPVPTLGSYWNLSWPLLVRFPNCHKASGLGNLSWPLPPPYPSLLPSMMQVSFCSSSLRSHNSFSS